MFDARCVDGLQGREVDQGEWDFDEWIRRNYNYSSSGSTHSHFPSASWAAVSFNMIS